MKVLSAGTRNKRPQGAFLELAFGDMVSAIVNICPSSMCYSVCAIISTATQVMKETHFLKHPFFFSNFCGRIDYIKKR